MALDRRTIYKMMREIRIQMNTPSSDRVALGKELERLRKEIGGFQYAEMPVVKDTIADDMIGKVTFPHFVKCEKCNRLLHFSVIGINGCYSCARI